jgi:hypothetical protein
VLSTTALGNGASYVSPWLDVAAWGALRLEALIAAIGGTIKIDWSMDGATVHLAGVAVPVTAAVLYDSGAVPVSMQYVRVTYVQGAGASGALLIVLLGLGAGSAAAAAIAGASASAPTAGHVTAINTDNSTEIATVQVGKRYRVTIQGGDGLCIVNSAGPADRTTDEPWYAYQKFEFVAVATKLYAQKLTITTSNAVTTVTPLDGGPVT